MENNLPQGLAVFSLSEAHRQRMRTSNMVERLNKEIKRRTRVAGLFPNEDSLLRLVSGVDAELSDEWGSGIIYLNIKETDTDLPFFSFNFYRKGVALSWPVNRMCLLGSIFRLQ